MIRKVIFTAAIFLVSAVIFVKNPNNGLFNPEVILIPSKVIVKDTKTSVRQDKLSSGFASWYDFKEGAFAASPYFKKGSILRVTNLENGKFVDVVVNDYGPDKRRHPNRVIDLDRLAFKKIASLELGLVRVKIHHLTD
jgi:rare lipoprotein A (peptidoglycan hydrolase)